MRLWLLHWVAAVLGYEHMTTVANDDDAVMFSKHPIASVFVTRVER